MKHEIIRDFEKSQKKDNIPNINIGDTLRISKLITEGKKQREQRFEGTLIRKKGEESKLTVVLRRIIDKVGVEKSFLVHSPLTKKIEVITKGKVRRAKLNYLRDRIGAKASKIKVKK